MGYGEMIQERQKRMNKGCTDRTGYATNAHCEAKMQQGFSGKRS